MKYSYIVFMNYVFFIKKLLNFHLYTAYILIMFIVLIKYLFILKYFFTFLYCHEI